MEKVMDWLEESKKFDQVADIYNKYRPSYPEELIDEIKRISGIEAGSRILEVGSGAGLATGQFLGSRYRITCVEQGANLIEAAKENLTVSERDRVSFINIPFQEWEEQEGTFDMMFSAQAFHWIPKPIGYKKVAKALKPGASMQLFWNKYMKDDSECLTELADLMKEYSIMHMMDEEDLMLYKTRMTDSIEVSGVFKPASIKEVRWEKDYTYDAFINFLKTANVYITMEDSERHILHVKLMDLFARNHYNITMKFNCVLFSAVRAD